MDNPVTNENPKPRLAVVFSGGFITALALWAGVAKAFLRYELLEQLNYTVGSSAGAFMAVVLGTRNPRRISQFITHIEQLKSDQIFKRRSIFRLGASHALLFLSHVLETWRNSAKRRRKTRFRLGKQTLVFLVVFAFVAAVSLVVSGIAVLTATTVVLLALIVLAGSVAISVLFTWSLWVCFWLARGALVALLLARLQHFLQNPKLHIDAFNDPAFIQDTARQFNAEEIAQELALSPATVELIYSDMRQGVSCSWSSLELKAMWEKKTAAQPTDSLARAEWRLAVQRFTTALFASASANVSFPPVRVNGDVLSDGALFRPDPLGPAFDAPADKILNFVVFEENPPDKNPQNITDAILFAFELVQRYLIWSEMRYADEKNVSVKELRKLRTDMREMAHGIIEEAIISCTKALSGKVSQELFADLVDELRKSEKQFSAAIVNRFQKNRFPFKEDQPIDPVHVIFSPDPGVENAIYGGPADFSAILEVIERGFRTTLKRLHEEKIICPRHGLWRGLFWVYGYAKLKTMAELVLDCETKKEF